MEIENSVNESIRNDYINGVSVKDISKNYNMCTSKVYIIIKDIQKKNTKISKDIVEKIVEEYKNGVSIKELSKKYNVSTASATRYTSSLRKNNKKKSKDTKDTKLKDIKELIIEDYNNGSSLDEISRKYNVSYATIYKYRAEYNAANIKNDYSNKMNIGDIAKKYDLDTKSVYDIIIKHLHDCDNKIINDNINKITEDFNNGMDIDDIARKYDLRYNILNNALKKYTKDNSDNPYVKYTKEELIKCICRDHDAGLSFSKISAKYNIPRSTAYDIYSSHKYNYKLATIINKSDTSIEKPTTSTATTIEKSNTNTIKFANIELIDSKLFKVTNTIVEAEMISGRHNICGVINKDIPYIFETLQDEEINDFEFQEKEVDRFINNYFNNSNNDTLMVYCTGLQTVLGTIFKKCVERNINLILRHYDASTNSYNIQQVYSVDNKPINNTIIYNPNNANLYLYNCNISNIGENPVVLSLCVYDNNLKMLNTKTIDILFRKEDENLVWSIYGKFVEAIHNDKDEYLSVFVTDSIIEKDGYIKYNYNISKSFNFKNSK